MDLSSLNMENIENILSSMSSEDMEMLSGMAQSLFASAGEGEKKEKEKEAPATPPSAGNPFSSFNIDPATLGRIMSIMQKLQSRPEDPRYNLLLSLRPMLSEKRQGRIDEALKLLSVLSLLPLLNEMGGGENG